VAFAAALSVVAAVDFTAVAAAMVVVDTGKLVR
jgi:hypothetical protein